MTTLSPSLTTLSLLLFIFVFVCGGKRKEAKKETTKKSLVSFAPGQKKQTKKQKKRTKKSLDTRRQHFSCGKLQKRHACLNVRKFFKKKKKKKNESKFGC